MGGWVDVPSLVHLGPNMPLPSNRIGEVAGARPAVKLSAAGQVVVVGEGQSLPCFLLFSQFVLVLVWVGWGLGWWVGGRGWGEWEGFLGYTWIWSTSLGRRAVHRAFLYCFFLAQARGFLCLLPVPILLFCCGVGGWGGWGGWVVGWLDGWVIGQWVDDLTGQAKPCCSGFF